MIVLDASAALEVLLRTSAGARIAARFSRPGETVHVPHLVDIEVAQVLRRLAMAGLDQVSCLAALADWKAMPVQRYPHDALLDRAWRLRANHTMYDAVYLALAESLGAPIVTHDRKLAGPGHAVAIEVI